jgi:uncharacterized SAM-binding protein YcdF (DUF218 family)
MSDINLWNLAVKLLTWAASPLGLLCLGVVFGYLLKQTRVFKGLGHLVIALALVQLLVFAMPITAHWLHQGLERRAAGLFQTNQGPPYQAILVLGGMTRSTETPIAAGWQPDLTEAADRLTHAASLWYEGLAPVVIASGGTWPSVPPKPAEALWMQQLLLQLGLPQQAIRLETASTTTRENMRGVANIMQDNGWQGRLALVTSASHMPRAVANAQRAGLTVDAYPTDWQAHAILDRPLPWLPNTDALNASNRALKEWIALLWRY